MTFDIIFLGPEVFVLLVFALYIKHRFDRLEGKGWVRAERVELVEEQNQNIDHRLQSLEGRAGISGPSLPVAVSAFHRKKEPK